MPYVYQNYNITIKFPRRNFRYCHRKTFIGIDLTLWFVFNINHVPIIPHDIRPTTHLRYYFAVGWFKKYSNRIFPSSSEKSGEFRFGHAASLFIKHWRVNAWISRASVVAHLRQSFPCLGNDIKKTNPGPSHVPDPHIPRIRK